MAANRDHIRKAVGQYIEFLNVSDIDSIAELYAEDATVEDPVGTEQIRGREAIHAFYGAALANKNASFEQTGKARVAAGQVAFPMHIHIGGTHTIEVIDLMVFDDDGLITSMRAFWSTDENQEGT